MPIAERGGGCTTEIFQFAWAGVKYGITRNLDFIAANYLEWQETHLLTVLPCARVSRRGYQRVVPRLMDVVSVVLDWRFLPKWDCYIGIDVLGGVWRHRQRRYYPQQPRYHGGVRFRF